MLRNFKWYSRLYFCYTGYAQSALRKKNALLASLIAIKLSLLDSLIASFVEKFKGKPRKHEERHFSVSC